MTICDVITGPAPGGGAWTCPFGVLSADIQLKKMSWAEGVKGASVLFLGAGYIDVFRL